MTAREKCTALVSLLHTRIGKNQFDIGTNTAAQIMSKRGLDVDVAGGLYYMKGK